MGAAIAIEVEFTLTAHGENTVEFIELKALCPIGGDIVDGAKSLGIGFLWGQISRQIRRPGVGLRCVLPVEGVT